jgi:hypothetical protein
MSTEKKKPFRQHPKKPEEGKTCAVPILKYGKGNNFHKLKAALSEAALKIFGNLGKLIKLEKYYVPKLVLPDYAAMGIDQANEAFLTNKAMKELAKDVGNE